MGNIRSRLGVVLGVMTAISLLGAGLAVAESPAGCTENNWSLDVRRSAAVAHIGDQIDYTVSASNGGTGACDLLNATVTFTTPDGTTTTLASGADFPADGSGDTSYPAIPYTVRAEDVAAAGGSQVNAVVTGDGELQDQPEGGASAAVIEKTISMFVLVPAVEVVKTADPVEAAPGDTVTYTITITNTGNTPLTTVAIDDTMFGSLLGMGCDFSADPPTYLNVGESCTIEMSYTVLEGDPDPLENIVTVQFQDLLENEGSLVTDTDDALVSRPAATVSIAIDKAPDFQQVEITGSAGCTPGYWKQRHHFGNWVGYSPDDSFAAVFGVPYEVSLLAALQKGGGGASALGRHAVAALLNASNGSVSYAYAADSIIAMVQDAFAAGEYESTKNALASSNEAGCDLGRAEPGSAGSGSESTASGMATFTITVTNDGAVPLAGVTVSDPLSPTCDLAIGDLAPDEVVTYECSAAVAESFTNVAEATGAAGDTIVSASDDAVVEVVVAGGGGPGSGSGDDDSGDDGSEDDGSDDSGSDEGSEDDGSDDDGSDDDGSDDDTKKDKKKGKGKGKGKKTDDDAVTGTNREETS